ncbi:MAG: hypothetical protein EOP35_22835 [Rubrivivax sp.]|nr:MAG: hypothetical protein EOP35_22835 [Rubrivivax sp.]
MNAWIGVGLALAALLVGGGLLGWQGVIFATTGIVFWLLLQMSRLMRVMKLAGAAPMGSVGNAVMLNSKLHKGMKLVDLISLAGSLGVKQAPETYVWRDPGDDAVEVVLRKGKLAEWRLLRAGQGTDLGAGSS